MMPGGDVRPKRLKEANTLFVNSNGEVASANLAVLLRSTFTIANLCKNVCDQLPVPDTRIDQAVRNVHQQIHHHEDQRVDQYEVL